MPKQTLRLCCLFISLYLGSVTPMSAQFDYKRASLTVLIIDNPSEPGNNLIVANVLREIEEKYNNHNIDVAVLKLPEGTTFDKENRIQGIEKALVEQKIGAKMLSFWFEDSLGNFTWEKVYKRGLYSASLFDFKNADRTVLGSRLVKDMGKELISKTYLLVMDFRNLTSTEEKGNQAMDALSLFDRRFSGVKKNSKLYGYHSQCFTYLFQIDFERDMYVEMYDKWKDRDAVLNVSVPLKLKATEDFTAIGSEVGATISSKKADSYYIKKLQRYAFERAMFRFSRKYDSFATKAVVMPTPDPKKASRVRPGALIGRKEGLKIDRKYCAYYRVERRDGTSFYRRKATLRADRVTDNRMVANDQTNPSRFYYDSGFSIKNGALIKEVRDFGMGLSAYVASTDARYLGVRYDYNLSQLTAKMKPQLRLYIEYSQNSIVKPNVVFDRMTMHWYGLGVARQFNTFKNLKTEIHGGYMWTRLTLNWAESAERSDLLDTSGETAQLGIRFLVNIAPNSRLFVDVTGRSNGIALADNYDIQSSVLALGFRFGF